MLQGNQCTNCPLSYTVSTGTIDATIWNPVTATSPGAASTLVTDWTFPNAKTGSIGTVEGND